MAIVGWYYLHENGELLYKPETGETAADIRESTFARAMWPCDPEHRNLAWQTLVEASAAGANRACVEDLARKWGCDDFDAAIYAGVVGIRLDKVGGRFAARADLPNLQPAGFGSTALEAMAELCKALGYQPSKTWGAGFADLVKSPRASGAET